MQLWSDTNYKLCNFQIHTFLGQFKNCVVDAIYLIKLHYN